MPPEPLISLRAAALAIGVHASTLGRQVRDGAIRTHAGGKVRLSEVLEDRANNVDLSRSGRYAGIIDG